MAKIISKNRPLNGPLSDRSSGRSSLVADNPQVIVTAVNGARGEDECTLLALFEKQDHQSYRRYDLKPVGDRLMFVRDEVDRMIEETIAAEFGTELEPDDRDGTFL